MCSSLRYPTVVTSRDTEDVQDLAHFGDALVLKLDVTDREQAEAAVKAAEEKFGRIDVLVNNAGIGYFAAVEESDEAEVRKMFDVNVFGLCRMIHVVLPGMRKRRQGCIVNLSSIGGLRSFPALGYYNSTKFAVEGVSEALWQEVEPLGIHVMLVEPSGFRTDWAGRSANETKHPIADYASTAGKQIRQLRAISGHQAGDPTRAAEAIVRAVESHNPPHRLLLGNDAYDGAIAKLDELREEFTAWESVSRGAAITTSLLLKRMLVVHFLSLKLLSDRRSDKKLKDTKQFQSKQRSCCIHYATPSPIPITGHRSWTVKWPMAHDKASRLLPTRGESLGFSHSSKWSLAYHSRNSKKFCLNPASGVKLPEFFELLLSLNFCPINHLTKN